MVRHRKINRRNGFKPGHKYFPHKSLAPEASEGQHVPISSYRRLPKDMYDMVFDSGSPVHDVEGATCENIHYLRPSPTRKTPLEMVNSGSSGNEANSCRIWHVDRAQRMFQESYIEHSKKIPPCSGVLCIDQAAEQKKGLGWKERLACNKCDFKTQFYELYMGIRTGERGPKSAELHLMVLVGLSHTGISGTGLQRALLSMNIPSPSTQTMQSSANNVGELLFNDNEVDMSDIKQELKELNIKKGFPLNNPKRWTAGTIIQNTQAMAVKTHSKLVHRSHSWQLNGPLVKSR